MIACWELLQPQRALPTQMAGAGVPGSSGQSRNLCLALYFTVGRRWNEGTTGEAAAGCPQCISLELDAAQLSDWATRKLNEGIRKKKSLILAEKDTYLLPDLCWELPSPTCFLLELTSLGCSGHMLLTFDI